jgi:hypothetical protein
MNTNLLSRRYLMQSLGAMSLIAPTLARAATPTTGPLVVPLIFEDERVWLSVTIGAETLPFILDTGADTNSIRDDVAKRLALPDTGERTRSVITDTGAQVARRVAASNVVIGGAVRQPRMLFLTGRIDEPYTAASSAGSIAGLLTTYDCDLRFGDPKGELRLWPGGRQGAAAGTPLPGSSIRREFPAAASPALFVTAMIDGKPYRLKVDTRVDTPLLLYPQAARRSGLWDAPKWAPSARARLVRATRVQLGPLALKRPHVLLFEPSGTMPGGIDGVIGLPLISLLDWSLDVAADKVWVARNTRRPSWRGYRMAGIWVDRAKDETLTIATVGPGSPAEVAGLKPGDRIVTTTKFREFLKSLDLPVGATLPLTIERAGVTQTVTLTMADYL